MSTGGDGRLIRLGVAVFVASCVGLLLAGWLLGPPGIGVEGRPIDEVATVGEDGVAEVTLDARDNDVWRGFSLVLGRPVPDGAAADLLVKRQLLGAPRGAVDLGPVDLATATVGPSPQWVGDATEGLPNNPVLSRWYAYSYLTHLLEPNGHTYGVRLDEGVAYLQVVNYYCVPEGGGCLTLRYRVDVAPRSESEATRNGPVREGK